MNMTSYTRLIFLLLLVGSSSCSKSKKELLMAKVPKSVPSEVQEDRNKTSTDEASSEDPKADPVPVPPVVVAKEIKTIIKSKLYSYPELTTLLAVNDVKLTTDKIIAEGGTIVYDPNRGKGSSIGFIVANLPPEKILDDKFIGSLNLKAISIENSALNKISPMGETPTELTNLTVPFHEIGVKELRETYPGKALGKNVTVAIIDTGIDASHPAFGDRVVYWQDLTREGDVFLKEAALSEKSEIALEKGKVLKVPSLFKEGSKIYLGKIDEHALGSQLDDADRTASTTSGLDINKNTLTNDVFYVVVGQEKDSENFVAYVDVNRTLDFSTITSKPILDFNTFRKLQLDSKVEEAKKYSSFLEFPSTNKSIKYPLIITLGKDQVPAKVTIGGDFGGHGTHVAGIVGANGANIQGAAPEANLMALKVCSGITCTDQAILRALIEAFYNPNGIIPEVVNLSLGSAQGYSSDIYSFLMRDLAAKFGATFFISASNSGPGLRSINSLGHHGPIVSVGAYVSKNSLLKHYDVTDLANAPEHGIFGFSSAGPSYTGQLRPNIVAPGSALSSTPLIDTAADMFNGTSMSSPLAAGGAAALISELKAESETNELLKKVFELKAKKALDARESKSELANLSMIDFPLAIRTALENTAMQVPNQSILRQGYGLISIPKALLLSKVMLGKFAEGPLALTDFKINANLGESPKDRLFDRSSDVASLKQVILDVEDDGERGQTTIIEKFKTTPFTLKLVRVDVESTEGSVESIYSNFPFAITLPGVEGQQTTERQILLGSGLKNGFISVRQMEKMIAGYTYVAVYELYRDDLRLLTLTDVVSKPLELSNAIAVHSVPSLAVESLKIPAAFSVKEKAIAANRNQRLPIAVRSGDQALIVQANISEGETGQVLVNVYSPNGKKVGEASIRRSPQSPTNTGAIRIEVPTSGKPGIYEVIVSTSSGRWMGSTKYDMLIKASRLQADRNKISLKTVASKAAGLKSIDYISVLNTALQTQSLKVGLVGNITRVESMKPFPVLPAHYTFKKIPLPMIGKDVEDESPITPVLLTDKGTDDLNCISRIDNHLYKVSKDGVSFDIAYSTTITNAGGDKLFPAVLRPVEGEENVDIYAAVETIACTIEGSAEDRSKGLDLEAQFPGLEAPEGMDELAAGIKDAAKVENNRFLVLIQAPQKLVLPADELGPRVRARAVIGITSGNPDFKEQIEVNIVQ